MRKFLLFATVAPLAFMSDTCETVMIKGAGGEPTRINKSDYDADQAEGGEKKFHLHTDNKKEQPEPQIGEVIVSQAPGLVIPPAPSAPNFGDTVVAPQTANADTMMVTKKGKKFILVYADKSPVTGFVDVDEAGYDTEGEAWAAYMRVKKQPFEQTIEPPANHPTAEQIADAAKNPEA